MSPRSVRSVGPVGFHPNFSRVSALEAWRSNPAKAASQQAQRMAKRRGGSREHVISQRDHIRRGPKLSILVGTLDTFARILPPRSPVAKISHLNLNLIQPILGHAGYAQFSMQCFTA